MTTCKRLHHFQTTVASLTSVSTGFGTIPNRLVTEVIVVDDSSSPSDRDVMLRNYPLFTFIFKSSHQRGHGRSMNILMNAVKTKYFIYIEDDWYLLPYSLSNIATAVLQSTNTCTDSSQCDRGEPIYKSLEFNKALSSLQHHLNSVHFESIALVNTNKSKSHDIISTPYAVLIMALAVLDYRGIVNIPTVYNHNITIAIDINNLQTFNVEAETHEKKNNQHKEEIHQVLFNDQSKRSCAVGDLNSESCSEEYISEAKGGWKRRSTLSVNAVNVFCNQPENSNCCNNAGEVSPSRSKHIDVPYSLHEFGLISSFSSIHDFTFWPGFSLNPGIWNLQEIKSRYSQYHRGCCKPNSLQENSCEDIFLESYSGFEHTFSMESYSLGLRMAYFPVLLFKHIGENISAYTLNGVQRPWDN